MKQVPFWVDDHPRPTGLTADLPASTDYLVIGSGFTGMSAARRLAAAGKDVVVIDAGDIAGGASAINGGFVSPDVKAGIDAVFATYGPRVATEMWQSTVRATDLVRDLAGRPGIDAITHDGGMAALGRGPRQRKEFEKDVAWYAENFGTEWRVVGPDQIHTVVGGDAFDTALVEPEGFGIHPARLAFGLAKETRETGALLVDQCEASAIARTNTGHLVSTSKGDVEAGDVIIATNGYTTRRPVRDLARLVVPVGSYMIATEPLDESVADSIFPGGVVAWHRKRLLNYMRRSHDNRILIGGRRSLHTNLDLAESARDLRETLVRLWPVLETAEITHVWGGKLAVPFDLTPHIGRIDGVWYAMGYAGHGVALSNGLGHELAGMLLGDDPPSIYSRIEHRGRFFHTGGKPWFLTPASLLYRTLDRFGI